MIYFDRPPIGEGSTLGHRAWLADRPAEGVGQKRARPQTASGRSPMNTMIPRVNVLPLALLNMCEKATSACLESRINGTDCASDTWRWTEWEFLCSNWMENHSIRSSGGQHGEVEMDAFCLGTKHDLATSLLNNEKLEWQQLINWILG